MKNRLISLYSKLTGKNQKPIEELKKDAIKDFEEGFDEAYQELTKHGGGPKIPSQLVSSWRASSVKKFSNSIENSKHFYGSDSLGYDEFYGKVAEWTDTPDGYIWLMDKKNDYPWR